MRVYFVRHGESVSNAGTDLRSLGGEGDALTELGWKQAKQLGQRLEGKPFSQIYVSAMQRAQETGSAMSEYIDAPIRFFPEIHEITRSSEEYQITDPQERFRSFIRYFDRMSASPPDAANGDGESFNEVIGRANLLLATLRKDESDADSVLVVSHGGFLRFLLGISILGNNFAPRYANDFMKVATINTGISEFELTPETFRLVTWMDQAHL